MRLMGWGRILGRFHDGMLRGHGHSRPDVTKYEVRAEGRVEI